MFATASFLSQYVNFVHSCLVEWVCRLVFSPFLDVSANRSLCPLSQQSIHCLYQTLQSIVFNLGFADGLLSQMLSPEDPSFPQSFRGWRRKNFSCRQLMSDAPSLASPRAPQNGNWAASTIPPEEQQVLQGKERYKSDAIRHTHEGCSHGVALLLTTASVLKRQEFQCDGV